MKAITLYQPWATLWALREKTIETRSWPTRYQGPIAIHSSKTFPRWAKELCQEEPFRSALQKHGIYLFQDLPLGAVLGYTELVNVVKMDNQNISLLSPQEIAFGDYRPGRFMWISEGGRRFRPPIAAIGARSVWDWEMPEGLIL